MRTGATKWLVTFEPNPVATFRLICFHHGGGGALSFRPWLGSLDPRIELVAVQLPGRESRFSERALSDPEQILDGLTPRLAQLNDKPMAFFGHSMGACLAYLSSMRLVAEGRAAPVRLFLSGSRPPQARTGQTGYPSLTDAEIVRRIRELGGTPQTLLDDGELLAIFLPALRADFELVRRMCAPPGGPLPIPITVLLGHSDPGVSPHEAEKWRLTTSAAFDMQMFEGGHFYTQSQMVGLVHAIQSRLPLGEMSQAASSQGTFV